VSLYPGLVAENRDLFISYLVIQKSVPYWLSGCFRVSVLFLGIAGMAIS